MELKELRSFCATARLQSITKAAEYLNIGQPTVTIHIRKLERELNLELLDRVKRPVSVTPAGATLARLASSHVDAIDSLGSRTLKAEADRAVSVGSVHDLIPHTLLRLVREFRTRNPGAQINIRSGLSNNIRDYVIEGGVEIGFVSRPMKSPQLDYQSLFSYERVLITPHDHPLLKLNHVGLEEIARWPLIVSQPGRFTGELLEGEFRRAGIEYETVMALPDMDMTKPYVAMGVGISVGSSFALEPEDRRELGIIDLSHILPRGEVGLVTARGAALSTAARLFLDLVEDSFRPLPDAATA